MPEQWDQGKATFKLVAIIMLLVAIYASAPIIGCTYLNISLGAPACTAEMRTDTKDLLFELLAVALALLGGAAAGYKIGRDKGDGDQ